MVWLHMHKLRRVSIEESVVCCGIIIAESQIRQKTDICCLHIALTSKWLTNLLILIPLKTIVICSFGYPRLMTRKTTNTFRANR